MGNIPKNFEKTVLFLAGILDNHQYAFRGTTSLVLQGIDMNIDDIDILSDKKTALKCNSLLKSYIIEKVEFKKSDRFKSFYGKFEINSILIEIMGNWQIKDRKGIWTSPYVASEKEITELDFKGNTLRMTNIATELSMFQQMGRWNAYHKIKRQIAENKSQQTSFL